MSLRSLVMLPAAALAGLAFLASAAAAQTASGRQLFKQRCQSCHQQKPGGTALGPDLGGVVGRKAASTAFKAYSPALRTSNLTWSRANLDKYLAAPPKMVPGTKMVVAVADAKQRSALLDYLATLR